MNNYISRRSFLKNTGALTLALGALPPVELLGIPNIPYRKGKIIKKDKLNLAIVGCGGKGRMDANCLSNENIVALCDVDWAYAKETFDKHPDVPKYTDFRRMLLEMDEKIDAITVTTPDHMHYPIAYMAITMGKHVFVQKPLTHSIEEARILKQLAKKHEVITIMGNQGHAGEGIRLVKEWIAAGAIGRPLEVHAYTNRPSWPQGMDKLPQGSRPPATLDWNLWQGVAREHPYSPLYAPFKWRGWWEYGCGALGDMGCHIMDAPVWSLDLYKPTLIEAESYGGTKYSPPQGAKITYHFPKSDKFPPIKLHWYDGKTNGKRTHVPRPKDLEQNRELSANGFYIVGTKGTLMDSTPYCQSPRIIPEIKMQSFAKHRPPKTIPRVPRGRHYQEWTNACKGKGPKPGSNFDYAADLTEICLLGNLALRSKKKRIEWDAINMRATNAPETDPWIRKKYRIF